MGKRGEEEKEADKGRKDGEGKKKIMKGKMRCNEEAEERPWSCLCTVKYRAL